MRGVPLTLRGLLLVSGVILLIFSNTASHAIAFQIGAVGLVGLAAAICVVTGRVRLQRLTFLDYMFVAMVFFSLTASVIHQDPYIFVYSLVFLATYASICVLVRTMSDEEIAFAITVSISLSVLLVFIVDSKSILTSLAPGAANRWELRFMPFGMTPDLAGYVYGGFVVVLLFSNFSNVPVLRHAGWTARVGLAGMSALITLAASARAGLLAVVLTLGFYVARNVTFHKRLRIYLILFVVLLFAAIWVFWPTVEAYMTEMLELNSSTRGLNSGGSGRLELWERGIELVFSRSWELLIGSGLRSSGFDQIGFSTESSYITLSIEMGIFLPFFLVGCFLFLLYRLGRIEFTRATPFDKIAFYFITFAMLQSVFNRYLIAIGNPLSLMFLLVVSRAFLKQSLERQMRMARGRRPSFSNPAPIQPEPAATRQRPLPGR